MSKVVSHSFHGVPVELPHSWEDHSVYRFLIPSDPARQPTPMTPSGGDVSQFQANLVVARMPRPTGESVFEEVNQALLTDEGARILRKGNGRALGRDAEWQDATFFAQELGIQIFQRQVACAGEADTIVLFTLTSSCDELEALAEQMGVTVS